MEGISETWVKITLLSNFQAQNLKCVLNCLNILMNHMLWRSQMYIEGNFFMDFFSMLL